jgi:hypothetical protein
MARKNYSESYLDRRAESIKDFLDHCSELEMNILDILLAEGKMDIALFNKLVWNSESGFTLKGETNGILLIVNNWIYLSSAAIKAAQEADAITQARIKYGRVIDIIDAR